MTHPARKISILRLRSVETRTGKSRSMIYDHLDPNSPRYDPTFPKQIRLGNGSAVGWVEYEIDDWLQSRIDASRSRG